MGIVLRESGFTKNVLAKASDISNLAIATAKSGIYNTMKMEEYDRNYLHFNPGSALKKYYNVSNGLSHMDTSLIQHVTFDHHNLITDPFTNNYDIIFCRNVMIYFDNQAKQKLFNKFYQSLKPNGLFIIGFYDAVLPLIDATKFKVLDIDAKIFQKI